MNNDMKKEPGWKILGFKSEWEYRKHLGKQKHEAQESGFTSYAEYQKNLSKDKLNKMIGGLEEYTELCNTEIPFGVPAVIRKLNKSLHDGRIDKSTYDIMIERIKSSANNFEKKCNCSGKTEAPIRDIHPEETMNRLKLLKESVESCRSDAPSMAFMANKSLGPHAGYTNKDPSHVTKGLREILNIAAEFKGCSCKR